MKYVFKNEERLMKILESGCMESGCLESGCME